MWSIHSRKETINIKCPWGNPDIEILEQFESAILNMFKFLKEIMPKEWKEIKRTMSYQENIKKERNYSKEPNRNSGVDMYNEWN